MIVRHADKPTTANEQFGIRPNGEHDKHSLTVRGWMRAGALVNLFAPHHGEPRPGLARPDVIYASGHSDDHSRRPVQTVTPLAERLGLSVHSHWRAGSEDELAAGVAERTGTVLVSWQHEAIPKIVRALGPCAAPEEWPDDRFDVVWTLTRVGSGWRSARCPSCCSPGICPTPSGDGGLVLRAAVIAGRVREVDRPRMSLSGVVLDCPDPQALARFYEELLGWRRTQDGPGWVKLAGPEGGAGLSFQQEDRFVPPTWPSGPGNQQMQVHLDIHVDDLDAAGAYATSVGARLAAYQPQDDVRVYLDPVGHPFCLFLHIG